MYNRGDIVIIKFPFADSAEYKKRPALIISNSEVNKTGDYLMVQITSKDKQDLFSIPLKEDDFIEKKILPLTSFLRFHKIFLLNETLIYSKASTVTESFCSLVTTKISGIISKNLNRI